jgi:hypothetical protein
VRLFKLSPSNSYEPHEGGQTLGMVLVGTSTPVLNYQILIYNGLKVPQCVVPINGAFQYNVRDLYMSVTDSQGAGWSILFDSHEGLANVIR